MKAVLSRRRFLFPQADLGIGADSFNLIKIKQYFMKIKYSIDPRIKFTWIVDQCG